jgi:hypothetical protein
MCADVDVVVGVFILGFLTGSVIGCAILVNWIIVR